MAQLTYVTLVPYGGTPVHLADQTGTPFATTGAGALVFANGPTINNVVIEGPLNLAASTTSGAPFNIAPGGTPTSPANGDIWTTAAGLFVRINGVTVGPLS